MPAPTPGNIELTNVVQLGADSKAQPALSEDEILETLFELARPAAPENTKVAMCETLAVAARTHDLPVGFFVRLINQESGFNPQAVSPVGAQGVAQFMPKVAEEWNLKNPFNPHEALVASARFLSSLKERFGNWGLAAAAYNGGSGRVQKWISNRGKLPNETKHYVKVITGLPAEQWVNGKPQNADFSISKRLPCQEIAHLADDPVEGDVPLPRSRIQLIQASAPQSGPSPKLALAPAVKVASAAVKISVTKAGTKVAVINVKKGSTKVAAVVAKIDAPASIVAEKSSPKGKGGKDKGFTKLAEKTSKKSAGKSKADKKQGKGRVQLADASQARK